jgi:small-conductance mechanosensitive channel
LLATLALLANAAAADLSALPGLAQADVAGDGATASALEVPADLTREGVFDFVAPLSDLQVRTLLINELRRQAEATTAREAAGESMDGVMMVGWLDGIQSLTNRLDDEWRAITAAVAGAGGQFAIALRNLTDQRGWPAIGWALVVLAIMLAVGRLAERGLAGSLREVHARLAGIEATDTMARLGYSSLGAMLDLIALGLFALVAYVVSLLFFDRFDPLRVFVTTYLFVIAVVRAVAIVGRLLLAPANARLRLLPLDDTLARLLYRWWLAVVALFITGFLSVSLLAILGIGEHLLRFLQLSTGSAILVVAMAFVWLNRERIANELTGTAYGPGHGAPVAAQLARVWYVPALAYLVLVWLIWAANIVVGELAGARLAFQSLLILLALPLVDWLTGTVLRYLLLPPAAAEIGNVEIRARFVAAIRNGMRLILVVAALLILGQSFGLGIREALGLPDNYVLLRAALKIFVVLVVAHIVWEMVKSAINRHLPQAESNLTAAFDSEGGETAPATRAQTLLPLLRTFLFVVLVTVVGLTVLASLGMNIAPFLAGAGVIGLAIGFGSQKLVQDVISGIFFLVDDAFRVGEYVEAAGMRGTVERISIRSLRLRHHLGPVETIPYSEVTTVKNHSRDYVIMKLPFRLSFDTDIDKVRKIIKKVGQQMLADPELGSGFLAPLKSQGVLETDDSALVMRMKFTAKPGEQWVIRREAYRRVRDALRAEGIEFAHRSVTVHMPAGAGDPVALAAGAAASAEQARKGPPDRGEVPEEIR